MLNEYLSQKRFDQIIDAFPQSKIGVIGDFFLDEYLILDKYLSEISVETSLEAYQVCSTRKSPGAAGTVTNILRSLNVPVHAIGFSGDDGHGFELRRSLNHLNVNLDHFPIATRKNQNIVLSSFNAFEGSKARSARARLGFFHQNIVQLVPDYRL